MDIDSAIDQATHWMDQYADVVAVAQGITKDKTCITVYVTDLSVENKLPKSLHGFPVVCEKSGEVTAQ